MTQPRQRYSTKQEALIVEYLSKNCDKHYTADEIWAAMLPNKVSRATVYRRLERLVEDGVLIKYNYGSGVGACYQYCHHEHSNEVFHFVCTKCKEVFHIDCSALSDVQGHLVNHHDFKIDNSRTVFYGICGGCNN